jgi:hypothetical protein
MRAYPTQEMGGLVFGYMGPEPAPLLPLYDLLRLEDGVRMIQVGNVNANWMNHVDEGRRCGSPGRRRSAHPETVMASTISWSTEPGFFKLAVSEGG